MKLELPRIAVTALCIPILATCGGGGGGGDNGGGGGGGGGGGTPANTIAITGDFTGGANTSLTQRLFAKLFPSAHALDASLVTRVVLISVDGTMVSANVTGGRFTINGTRGSAFGMIFVGSSNNFLGFMRLADGMDTVALGKVASGTTTIDLNRLSSNGQTVRGARSPLGHELPLSPEEQAALTQASAIFSGVVRNPDVDGNASVDALEGKHFNFSFLYLIQAGSFGPNLVATVDGTPTFSGYNYELAVKDADPPSSVRITGPDGSGLSNQLVSSNLLTPGFATYATPRILPSPVPPEGTYTVAYRTGTNLTFTVPNQSTLISNVVLPVPTVTLNGNSTVQRVNWGYRLASSTNTMDPLAVLRRTMVHINHTDPSVPAGDPCSSSGNLSPSVTEFVPSCQTINWSNVGRVTIEYVDIYGNSVTVDWRR